MIKLFAPTKKKNGYPAWVVKTDEERVQNMPFVLQNKIPFQVTEKLDGTSTTFTLKKIGKNKFDFIICSRNMVVGGNTSSKKTKLYYDTNVYCEMAQKYDVENILKSLIKDNEWITLQGETIGESIQGNKYNLKGRDFYAFNLITEKQGKIDSFKSEEIMRDYGIKWCPLIANDFILPDTIDELMKFSTGKSRLYDTLREGYVFRNYEKNISFKCVSNDFLLKWGL